MMQMKRFALFCLVFVSMLLTSFCYAADIRSPVGYWKTIDDVTGQPKSIVRIWLTSKNTLQGQVKRIYPSPGKTRHELCAACEGANYNKPIEGMIILWGFRYNGQKWTDGYILDPKNGKIYNATIKESSDGMNLSVHGYVGISIIGRTQTWDRVSG